MGGGSGFHQTHLVELVRDHYEQISHYKLKETPVNSYTYIPPYPWQSHSLRSDSMCFTGSASGYS